MQCLRGLLRAMLLVVPCALAAQTQTAVPAPVQMPADRVADSYDIYNLVLPSAVIEWSDVPRTQWLLEASTSWTPAERPCPGLEVTPPAERMSDWAEVVADYAATCHARFALDVKLLHQALPVRLLDDAEKKRYVESVMRWRRPAGTSIMQAPPTPDEFQGAAGMHRVSAVYFNRAHTLAAVEFGMFCGGLCGNGTTVVFARTPSGWVQLPWRAQSWIS